MRLNNCHFTCAGIKMDVFLQNYMTYDLQIRQSADFIIVVCLSQFTLYVFPLGVGASFLRVGGSLFFECGEPQTK